MVDTYKTMSVVNIGLILLDRGLHDCISVSIGGHIPIVTACHEQKLHVF